MSRTVTPSMLSPSRCLRVKLYSQLSSASSAEVRSLAVLLCETPVSRQVYSSTWPSAPYRGTEISREVPDRVSAVKPVMVRTMGAPLLSVASTHSSPLPCART